MNEGNCVANDDHKAFDFFRQVYNDQIKSRTDCELAFHHSIRDFFNKYGYKPYENLEEYLAELFKRHNGFQLFNRYF
jgi:hypothetical protein